MNHPNYWKDKRVLITGGTSGLGRALALQLHRSGARVALVARSQEKLDELNALYPEILCIQGDVSDKKAIYPITGEVHARLGDIDVLLNVASYLGQTPLRLLIDTDCEDFEQVLQTNVLGPFRLSKAFLPEMLLRRRGVVVNISSNAAINAYSNWGSYSVSKAGIDHLSRIFDEEVKDHGVRFLSIDPGDMNTPMHFDAIPDADPGDLKEPEVSASEILDLLAQRDYSEVRRSL
jgi:NAD(P)-dependent dehydrogenase (short-subunit alcohol dehydrogenase family)